MNNIPQEDYNKILQTMPIACIDITVVSGGSVLLVKRKDAPAKGQWWVLGGRILKGEMMRDCAIRKTKEETGMDCHIGPIIHTDETIFEDGPNGIPVHSINSCFLVYPKANCINPVLDSHHTDYRWVNRIEPDLHIYVQRCLRGAGLI